MQTQDFRDTNSELMQVVFDGGSLPAKLVTQQQRRARKAEKLQKARTLMAEGNVAAASTAFCATVDVTCGKNLSLFRRHVPQARSHDEICTLTMCADSMMQSALMVSISFQIP